MTTILDHLDLRPLAWQDSALCAQTDPALFDSGDAASPTPYEPARAICRQCPVAGECLAYALDHNEKYGMWGGKTPGERDALRKERRTGIVPNWAKAKAASVEAYAVKARATLAAHEINRANGRTNEDIAYAEGISAKSYSRRVTRARRTLEARGEITA